MNSANHHRYRYPSVRPELPPIEAWEPIVARAYESNWFTNYGALSREFESALASLWGGEQTECVTACNATAALAAPLIANRIEGPVLIPSFTFPATLAAVKMVGATPLVMDVAANDWTVSAEGLAHALTRSSARAAIVVSPFGLQRDFSEHAEVANRHGAYLVIDSAAGLGLPRIPLESRPNVYEVYSLHATKPFGIGEGGVIFAHKDRCQHLRSAMNFGLPDLGASGGPTWGINGKMSEFAAAIALATLKTFPDRLVRRQALAQRYMHVLSGYADLAYVKDASASTWQLFPILAPSEAQAKAAVDVAASLGLEIRRYYRPALSLIFNGGDATPTSEDLAGRMICFPVYSYATEAELAELCSILEQAVSAAIGER